MKTKEIIPGKSVGELIMGMSRTQVENILGKPDEIDEFTYDDGEKTVTWYYFDLNIDLNFEEDDDFRLSFLSVNSDEYSIKNKIKVGMQQLAVVEQCKALNLEFEGIESIEDTEDEKLNNEELITIDKENINFWFIDGILEEIQIGPLWKDDDTPIWSEPSK